MSDAQSLVPWDIRRGKPHPLVCKNCGAAFGAPRDTVRYMTRSGAPPACSKACRADLTHGPVKDSKACTKCGVVKSLGEFYADTKGQRRDGRGSECRACHNAKSRAWERANRERVQNHRRAKYQTDPEAYRALQRRHRMVNRDRYTERLRQRRADLSDRCYVLHCMNIPPDLRPLVPDQLVDAKRALIRLKRAIKETAE